MSDENLPCIRQSNNKVAGNMAAGNIIINHEKKTPLRRMVENYRQELEHCSDHREFIEELQDYMKRVVGHEQRGLEIKLSAGKRTDLVANGTLLKEKFAKKLYKHTFSPIAQNIFVHILAMVKCSFELKIKPMITENYSTIDIDRAIYNDIVHAVYLEVGDSELGFNMDYIHGMLYFLTGNCYIDWD